MSHFTPEQLKELKENLSIVIEAEEGQLLYGMKEPDALTVKLMYGDEVISQSTHYG